MIALGIIAVGVIGLGATWLAVMRAVYRWEDSQ